MRFFVEVMVTPNSLSDKSSNGSETDIASRAVHRLVAESVREAHSRESDEATGSVPYEEATPAEKNVVRQVYMPVKSTLLKVAGPTLRGTRTAMRPIARGGELSIKAALGLREFGARSLQALTDRELASALVTEAEAEGRWLVEGLAGLAGFGRSNP